MKRKLIEHPSSKNAFQRPKRSKHDDHKQKKGKNSRIKEGKESKTKTQKRKMFPSKDSSIIQLQKVIKMNNFPF